jgi:hypothetical protein
MFAVFDVVMVEKGEIQVFDKTLASFLLNVVRSKLLRVFVCVGV